MKTTILFIAAVLTICTSFTPSLSTALVTDYRDVYVGNYFCSSNCNGVRTKTNGQTSTTDAITIDIEKDILDSILRITMGQNALRVKIKNNILTSFDPNIYIGGKFFGMDSIAFSISRIGSLCNYKGKRK